MGKNKNKTDKQSSVDTKKTLDGGVKKTKTSTAEKEKTKAKDAQKKDKKTKEIINQAINQVASGSEQDQTKLSDSDKKVKEEKPKSKSLHLGMRRTRGGNYGCTISRSAYTRNQITIGQKTLPPTMTENAFYNTRKIPSSPIKSILSNFIRDIIAQYESAIELEKFKSGDDILGSESSKSTNPPTTSANGEQTSNTSHHRSHSGVGPTNVEKAQRTKKSIIIASGACIKLIHAIDKYASTLFTHAKLFMTTPKPCQNPKKFTPGYFSVDETSKELKTTKCEILYQAYQATMVNPKKLGPNNEKSLKNIEAVFDLFQKLADMKPKKPKGMTKGTATAHEKEKYNTEKKKYDEKKAETLEKLHDMLNAQSNSFLYKGDGYLGVLKRYGVHWKSEGVRYVLEVYVRVFVEEIIHKCLIYCRNYDSSSINEQAMNFALFTCNFNIK